jgi:DNA-binding transcriptional LysR family regulator
MIRDPRPALLRSDIDLPIGSFPGVVAQLTAEQDPESPIRYCRLYIGEYVCVMRKDHPLANAELTVDSFPFLHRPHLARKRALASMSDDELNECMEAIWFSDRSAHQGTRPCLTHS